MGLIDYILIALVGVALGFAIGIWNKNRKAGKTCGGDCARCAGSCKK